MDNLTHSLFGLTLARTPLGRTGRGTTVALLLASNAPDIDIVATAGGAANYLEWHRGPTHGPIGIVGLGLVTAIIATVGRRWWDRRSTEPSAPFLRLWGVCCLGVLCHILMDLPTSYGVRPLSPFSWTWFAEDWMPIVDIYLLAILAAGLWFGRSSRLPSPTAKAWSWPGHAASAIQAARHSGRNAAIALSLMVANYGVRAVAHHEAILRAPRVFGAQLPSPCADRVATGAPIEYWPRSRVTQRDRATTRCLVEIAAMPNFVSPFRWRLIAELSSSYEVRTLNLLERRQPVSDVRLVSVHYPNQWTPPVLKAAVSPIAQVFLGFSRFPAARSVLDAEGNVTVRWTDMRFDVDIAPGPRERAPNLFGATILLSPDGAILRERLGS